MRYQKLACGLALFFSMLASAQLSISPAELPDAVPGQLYYQELQANGGTAPYRLRMHRVG